MYEIYYYVYIMTNISNKIFYVGVTNDLYRRVLEHKSGSVEGFTKKYRLTKLVYFEVGTDIAGAIFREKQIKAGSRLDKVRLITGMNPGYRDLFEDIQG